MRAKDERSWPFRLYDTYRGHVVRAKDEAEARSMADKTAADENARGARPWLDDSLTSCEPLKVRGPRGIVLSDFAAG